MVKNMKTKKLKTGIADMDFASYGKAMGRNGSMCVKGLEIQVGEDDIHIFPITSKDKLGNCFIRIPREELGKLIGALADFT